jgi:hypothetical protein
MESAHTLVNKPYRAVTIDLSRVCRDTFCDLGDDMCSHMGSCPTRCGGCNDTLHSWALVSTEISLAAELQPPKCCNISTCYDQQQFFQTGDWVCVG